MCTTHAQLLVSWAGRSLYKLKIRLRHWRGMEPRDGGREGGTDGEGRINYPVHGNTRVRFD